jgi:DTW domain-containing protein
LNKEEYLIQRKRQEIEKQREEMSFRVICPSCRWKKEHCFCTNIHAFDTRARFVLLMHPMEAKKEKLGTGRISHLNLINSEIVVGVDFTHNKRINTLLKDDDFEPFLLYPGEESINLSTHSLTPHIKKRRVPLFFIIDGTWPCAKTMMRESANLHNLKRVSFNSTSASLFTIKQQPAKFCLSTIESISRVIDCLEEQGLENTGQKKDGLVKNLVEMVEYQKEIAKNPPNKSYRNGSGYSEPKDRKENKKWLKWKICFDQKNYECQKDFFN